MRSSNPSPHPHLAGWPGADAAAALDHFRRNCSGPDRRNPCHRARVGRGSGRGLRRAQGTAPGRSGRLLHAGLRCLPYPAAGRGTVPRRRTGFLTGYFEPELTGSLTPGDGFATPVLARPDDLVSLNPGNAAGPRPRPSRRAPDARRVRALSRSGRHRGRGARRSSRPLLYLRDAVDLFVLQVQGSGRVRLPDGRAVRVLYDGRNGQPYTSIAKRIVAEGHLPLEGLTLARWTSWLRANPDAARRLMRANASYIFFRLAEVADSRLGPPGAAGVPLVPGRSLAVDATLWRYGLPFWLEGTLPAHRARPSRRRRRHRLGHRRSGPRRPLSRNR